MSSRSARPQIAQNFRRFVDVATASGLARTCPRPSRGASRGLPRALAQVRLQVRLQVLGRARALLLSVVRGALGPGVVLAIGVIGAACGGGRAPARPTATLSNSTEAQVAFAPIVEGWSTQSRKGRAQLAQPLEAFLRAYPSDGDATLARAYLAFLALDARDGARADAYLRSLEATTPPGSTRDLVTIARAEHERVIRGRPAVAFELLRPLVGKVVDPASRALLQEGVSLAAIEAHRDYEAIAYMDTWLANAAEEERAPVHAKVQAALAKLPPSVLEGSLRAMRARGGASGYGREIERLVSERLAEIAVANGDPDMARWLLDPTAGTALLGDAEGALSALSTSHRGESRLDGRTVGLLLPTGSDDFRNEAADVMRGVAWALDLPRRNPTAGDATKLSTRDDAGDPERVVSTMAELAGEGAAVILAALDPRSADRAIEWGEAHAVPVIVLAVPATQAPRDFGFVVGEARAHELAALATALGAHGVTRAASVVAAGDDAEVPEAARAGLELLPPIDCDVDPPRAGEPRFPVAAWKADHVSAWLVEGPAECARDVVGELASAGNAGLVALVLEAADTRVRSAKLRLMAAAAGVVPRATLADATRDAELASYATRRGSAPSWWTALGRDAAALARAGVAALPLDLSTDVAEVTRRRSAVKAAIASAKLHLWTTDASGMAGAHVLPRELHVIDLASDAPPKR